MIDRRDHDLDTFEAALLAELIAAVRQPEPADPSPAQPTRLRRRRPWILAAAALLAAAVLVPVVRPTPAFAVTGRDNGEVRVKVNRLEGADELERALGKRGIAADITYLPPGKECAPGRYVPIRTPGLSLSVSAYKFWVTIPPGSVGTGDTFVLEASVIPSENGVQATVNFDITAGPIGPCNVIDSP